MENLFFSGKIGGILKVLCHANFQDCSEFVIINQSQSKLFYRFGS